jgi:RNA recognition motif-containing protein
MASEISEKEEQNPQQDIPQEPNQEISSKEENTQILIKNITETTTEEMLEKIFEKYGKILKIKIEQDMDGKRTGEAIIEFETKQEKDLVVNSSESIEIDGKKIEIKDLNNEGLTLFVGNIPYSATVEEIEEFFSECGKVDVKFFYINNSFKGYAYVTFQDINSTEIALKKNGEKLGGREIKIDKLKSRNYIQIQRGGRRGGYRGRGRGGSSFGHFDRERKEDYFRERRERDRFRYRDLDRGRPYNRFRDNRDRERERDREWNRDRRERSRERSRDREYNRIRERNERDRHRDFERDREERDRNDRERDRNDRERERERNDRERDRNDRDRNDRDRNDRDRSDRDRNDRDRDKQRENERHRDYERDRSNGGRERRHSNYDGTDEW